MLGTLRGRLIVAMLLILVLAVGVSTVVDRRAADTPHPGAPIGLVSADAEATQDAWVLAGFSLPALVLIWLVSSWSLRPLRRVSQEALRIGPRDTAARLTRTGLPTEITPLVDAVNGALARMADANAAERRFTENAAHELRTPLAVLGLRLQRARQASGALDWQAIERDLAQMNRLVSQLLDLAHKENAGRDAAAKPMPVVNLSRVAREAAAMILPIAEARARVLAVRLPDTLAVRGNAGDLRDAVLNLLENAVLHGSGTITLDSRIEDAAVVLAVRDEGAGIPDGQGDEVFERFRKGGGSEGTGLGLAIVREVVRGHGGEVAFRPGAPCVIEMRLGCARD